MRAPSKRGAARAVAATLIFVASAPPAGGPPSGAAGPVAASLSIASARAEGGWDDAEFEAVCARTQDAMTLSSDELRSLVRRADALVPGLARLDESRRKVYARRLKLCRDLYAFVLESRGGPGS